MVFRRPVLTASLLFLIPIPGLGWLPAAAARAEDWPQWLGVSRAPVWRETGIVESFPKAGPPLLWKVPLGSGYSGPAVAGGKVFVMDRQSTVKLNAGKLLHEGEPPRNHNFVRRLLPGRERVVCLRERDGKVLWTHDYDCPYTTVSMYAIGPRCTPTVDGARVYSLGAEGDLFCLDAETGKVHWSRDFKKDFDLRIPPWGVAAHPLVDGDRLICMVGGKDATCVAFDKRTGRELWRSGSAKEPGYCPPVIYELAGRRQLVIWDSEAVRGLDPESGKPLWSVAFPATFAMSIGAPQQNGNDLFLMSFSRKSAVVRVAEDGGSAEIVWRGNARDGVGGVLNTAVIHDGHVYACGSNGRYMCVELKTGRRRWTSFEPSTGRRPASWANVFTIRQGKRFFHANDLGDLIIARMTPQGYEEVSRAHLIEPTHEIGGRTVVWSHPAFANQCVFLRNDREIRRYSLAADDAVESAASARPRRP